MVSYSNQYGRFWFSLMSCISKFKALRFKKKLQVEFVGWSERGKSYPPFVYKFCAVCIILPYSLLIVCHRNYTLNLSSIHLTIIQVSIYLLQPFFI